MSDVPALIPVGGSDLLGHEEGYIIGSRGHALMRLATDRHMITIAGTGGGKGRSVAISNVLDHSGSIFSVEIGGATYLTTHKFRKAILKQDIHLFDPFGATGHESAKLNILDMLDPNSLDFITRVKSLARSLVEDSEGLKESNPYWVRTPQALLRALIIYTKTSDDVDDKDRHLPFISSLLAKYPSESWDELMENFALDTGKFRDTLNPVGNYYKGVRDENVRSLVSSVEVPLNFTQDPAISRVIKESTLDLRDLRKNPTSIYIVMKEMEDYRENATWLRLMVESAFAACPNTNDAGKSFKHNDRVLFMLDEFTQLGKLQAIETGMVTARQKGITIWSMFQDIPRLEKLYGKEIADSFLGGAGVVQVFEVGDEPTKEYVSKRAGKRVALIPQVTHGLSYGESSQRSWSRTESLGMQENFTEGVALSDTETWQHTDTLGTSHTLGTSTTSGTTYTSGTTFGTNSYSGSSYGSLFSTNSGRGSSTSFQSSTSYSNSSTTSESSTTQRSHADSKGGSKGKTDSESRSRGTSSQSSDQHGESYGENRGITYQVSYTPHILPSLEPYQVEQVLGTNNRQILFIRSGGVVRTIIDQRANHDQIPALRRRAYGPEKPDIIPKIEALPTPKMLKDMRLEITSIPISVPTIDFSKPIPDYAMVSREYSDHSQRVLYAHGETEKAKASSKKRKGGDSYDILSAKEQEVGAILSAAPAIEKAEKDFSHKTEEWRRHWRAQRSSIKNLESAVVQKEDKIREQIKAAQKLVSALDQYEGKINDYRQDLLSDFSHIKGMKAGVDPFHDFLRHYGMWRETWTDMDEPERPTPRLLPAIKPKSFHEVATVIQKAVPALKIALPILPDALPVPEISSMGTEATSNPTQTIKALKVWPDREKKNSPKTLSELEADIARMQGGKKPNGLFSRVYRGILKLFGKLDADTLSDFRQARYSLARKSFEKIGEDISSTKNKNEKLSSDMRAEVNAWKKYYQGLIDRNASLDEISTRLSTMVRNMQRHKKSLDELPHAYLDINQTLEYERAKVVNQIGEWDIWRHLRDQSERLAIPQSATPKDSVEERTSARPFDSINEGYREQFRGPDNNHGPS